MSKFTPKYTIEDARRIAAESNCKLISNYRTLEDKCEFICPCGNHFVTTFNKFIYRNKRQCNKCGRESATKQSRQDINNISKEICSYGCELLSQGYKSVYDLLIIKCKCGNVFEKSLHNFRNSKHQCTRCSRKDSNESKNKYTQKYVRKLLLNNGSELINNDNKTFINTKSNITLKCCDCGKTFTTNFGYLLSENKYTCSECSYSNAPLSIGEIKVKEHLDSLNISYKQQFCFDDCKYKHKLRFDFAVFKNDNIYLIEFDGKQHFQSVKYYGGQKNFEHLRMRDLIKNDYCIKNHIPLLRIRFDEIQTIKELINKFLNI